MREAIANANLRARTDQIRPAALAGKYYPEEPEFLARVIDKLLAGAHPVVDGQRRLSRRMAGSFTPAR